MIKTKFSQLLTRLRTEAGLTNKALGKLAKVPPSFIAGAQSGKRRIGELQARKIGHALKLAGPPLEDFVFAAINTCSEKVLEESKSYPAELLNLLARQLSKAGILAEAILECIVTEDKITLSLSDGASMTLTTQLLCT